LKIDIKPPEKP